MNEEVEKVISYEALYASMLKCQVGVMWKASVAHFVLNGASEISKLENELRSGTYLARKTKPFYVYEPKKREVMGMSFRDRVFQRSLTDNIVYPELTRRFIYDNAACQTGKGTDFARDRLHCFLHKFYRRHRLDGYILQCDIAGYYKNMSHEVLKNEFRTHLSPEIYVLVERTFNCEFEGDRGYYPGSQIMQISGAALLNDLDHYIKEKLRIKYYLRYMDDFILLHHDKDYLESCRLKISSKLAEIQLELHPKKTRIYPLNQPIKFLGFYHRLTPTGKVVMLLDPKNVKRERKKLYRMVQKAKRGEGGLNRKKIDECYQSWKAHASHGNSYKLLQRMDDYYESLWK